MITVTMFSFNTSFMLRRNVLNDWRFSDSLLKRFHLFVICLICLALIVIVCTDRKIKTKELDTTIIYRVIS